MIPTVIAKCAIDATSVEKKKRTRILQRMR